MTTKEIKKQIVLQKIHDARVKRAINNIKNKGGANKMNELENITKTYCNICGRFIGYMQKDRHTLKAPITICHVCEKLKNKQTIGSSVINTICIVALTLAVILIGIWSIGTIIN